MSNSTNPILKISASRLLNNIDLYRKFSKNAELGCVLKSNAYGCGLQIVAKFLNSHGINTFFVATHDEAHELATYLSIESKIYVLADFWEHERVIKKSKIISVASTIEDLIKLKKSLNDNQFLQAAVHFDCGLNRYGIQDSILFRKELGAIKIDNPKNFLIIAHLSHSDDFSSEENSKQLRKLLKLKQDYTQFKYSISGSAGVLNSNVFSLDLIRPGLSLFGASSTNSLKMKQFKNVITLIAPILQIKILQKGDGIGYSHKFIAKKESYIATAKIGYADGIDTQLYLRNFNIFYNNKPCKLVGRISMDLISFEVDKKLYNFFQKNINKTQYAELINDAQNPDTISSMLDTIPHEFLTGISSRIERELSK